MKKFVLILSLFMFLGASAKAEVYHGIDIDAIYKSSDWNNKEEIKELIDDYTLLLQYQKELDNCADFDCLDSISEKIMQRFYSHNLDDNLTNYHNYVKSTFAAYGVLYCLNKYNIPSGTMCNQETLGTSFEIIKNYTQSLISQIKQKIDEHEFITQYTGKED